MRKAALLIATISVCAALAIAQDTPSPSSQSGSTTTTTTQTTTSEHTSSGNNIQGCLTGTTGNYVLTDAMGVSYKLQGDDSELGANINKEVEVTGNVGSSASASAGNNPDSGSSNGAAQSGSSQGEASANAGGASGTSTGATATANASKTLDVSSVKKISDSCSSGK